MVWDATNRTYTNNGQVYADVPEDDRQRLMYLINQFPFSKHKKDAEYGIGAGPTLYSSEGHTKVQNPNENLFVSRIINPWGVIDANN